MTLDTHHIDNRMERCAACTKKLADRDRVVPSYVAGEMKHQPPEQSEVGLLIFRGEDRPFFVHVNCFDPTLQESALLPSIHYCICCQLPLGRRHFVHPVYQVVDPRAADPAGDPLNAGVAFGDRIHFAHIDCKDPEHKRTSALVV
jgi:hypothetical protein